MNEACTQAQDFLNAIFDSAGFDLRATIDEGESGCFLNIEGADSSLLLSEGGELLEALQHILNQAFGREVELGAAPSVRPRVERSNRVRTQRAGRSSDFRGCSRGRCGALDPAPNGFFRPV